MRSDGWSVWPAVGAPLERGVRHQRADYCQLLLLAWDLYPLVISLVVENVYEVHRLSPSLVKLKGQWVIRSK